MKKPEKKSILWEDVLKDISNLPVTQFKTYIEHFIYIDEENINFLKTAGFKVYRGDWNGIIKDCLIIEW